MAASLSVLIIEDSAEEVSTIIRDLIKGGYDPKFRQVNTERSMQIALEEGKEWDVVISNFKLEDFSGLQALSLLQQVGRDIPFIFRSRSIGEELAVSCIKSGAHDFVLRDKPGRLVSSVAREIDDSKMRRRKKESESTIAHLAHYDSLTKLPNRILFQDRLNRALSLAQREGRRFALLFIDFNRFKEINDSLGHQAGDNILCQIADRLGTVLRKSDTVARIGGDEFAILLMISHQEDAERMARNLVEVLQAPFIIEELPVELDVRIGISLFPGHGEDAKTLLQKAEGALIAAKETGKRNAIYRFEQDRFNLRKPNLIGELNHAINRQLILHYQPVVEIKSGKVIGIEGLVRWQHPLHGLIPPDQFLLPAEQTGLIVPLTRWVLQEAVRECRILHESGFKPLLSVNLSARMIHDVHLPRMIGEILEATGTDPSTLGFEISESAMMMSRSDVLKVLTQLRALGVRLCIDDFGTGFMSLDFLSLLPVDNLKIDHSFTIGMTLNERDRRIVRSIIDLGHNLGLQVSAEGVENTDHWNLLASYGCDAAQGYLIARPLPVTGLNLWLKDSARLPETPVSASPLD